MKARVPFGWFLLLCFVVVVAKPTQGAEVDPVCLKWFQANSKKIKSACVLECPTFRADMGAFHCPDQCGELCEAFTSSTSGPGTFLFYPGLTKAERELIDKNPKEAIIVFIQKTKAELSAGRNFSNQGFSDESDAFRHFVWAGLLTKELGSDRAKVYLDSHEANPLQKEAEKAMDLANNRGGILAAEKLIKESRFTQRNLEQAALDEMKSKNLIILSPGLPIPKEPK